MKKDNKGFSLVELIIVIAIMAVLIGILAPQYLKYVRNSKISTDVTNAQEIANAVNVAISDGQITAGGSFSGVGGSTITAVTIDNLKTLPVSRVDKSYVWEVTYTLGEGVKTITLNGNEIYPDPDKASTGYQTVEKAK